MKRPAAAMIDSWNKILNLELMVRHGITCFLGPLSLMALRAIGRCGHAIAAVSIRQLSVAELVKETPVEVRDKAQAFIEGALPPRECAQSLLNLVSAEANQERQIQLLKAISLFNGGLRSDHVAFAEADATWWDNSPCAPALYCPENQPSVGTFVKISRGAITVCRSCMFPTYPHLIGLTRLCDGCHAEHRWMQKEARRVSDVAI